MADIAYPIIVRAAKTWFKVAGITVDMVGNENIPATGGALLAMNHLSYVDYLMSGYPGVERHRYTRFMAKKEIFETKGAGEIMRACHHLVVDRENPDQSLVDAANALRAGELVAIFPEATISRAFTIKDLKTGAVRLAAEAGVPLIPVTIWGTQRIMTKGQPRDLFSKRHVSIVTSEPMYPTGADPVAETAELRARMEATLDQQIREYPDGMPAGAWWLPKAYGGSAPTLEEAAEMYAEERRLRAERKAAKAAAKSS